LNGTVATPGPADGPNLWGIVWLVGLVLVGLFLLLDGLTTRPPDRAALTAADHVGPISYTTPLVSYNRGRRRGNYRTQVIPLAVPGFGTIRVSPPPTLWVDDLDHLRRGQRVRFLVDPHARMVFEATTEGRTLLSYEASAESRRGRGNGAILAGLVCLGVAGLHGFIMRRAG